MGAIFSKRDIVDALFKYGLGSEEWTKKGFQVMPVIKGGNARV